MWFREATRARAAALDLSLSLLSPNRPPLALGRLSRSLLQCRQIPTSQTRANFMGTGSEKGSTFKNTKKIGSRGGCFSVQGQPGVSSVAHIVTVPCNTHTHTPPCTDAWIQTSSSAQSCELWTPPDTQARTFTSTRLSCSAI